MKRMIMLGVMALVWGGGAATANAGAFGLFYPHGCSSCSPCGRPYNAFSGGSCCAPGCGHACGYGCGAGCGHGCGLGCGFFKGGCGQGGLLHRLHKPGCGSGDCSDTDCGPNAFGVGNFAPSHSHTGYSWGPGPYPLPATPPPPGPYVAPSAAPYVWLPPQPFPGMYGVPPQAAYMPAYAMPVMPKAPPQAAPKAPQQQKPVQPVSYQPSLNQGYQPIAYPMQQYQGWYYAPAYWGQR